MSAPVDERLRRLRHELDDHARVAEHLGIDLERPLRSLDDGYPENAIALVGKITEKLLKQLWRHHEVAGDPSGRMLSELIKGCRPHIRSSTVLDALTDIQRLRNRSTHDGYEIAEEDGLLAVRRLVDVLAWFTSTASPALTGNDPRMQPEVARRVEFLAGLYLTLGYRVSKRFVLSTETVYQLFCRESGVRLEYVELLLSKDAAELRNVLETTGGELLKTRLPKLTRFVILDDAVEQLHPLLGHDYRIVGYEGFIDTVVDLQTHLASCATAVPEMPRERQPLPGALLTTDPHTGESRITETEDAEQLLTRLMQESANVLITGKPGSGKSTLLRALVNDTPATARRFRFYFDLSLKPKDEAFAEYVARMLAPCVPGERARAFDLFLYLIRSGSALCVLDAVDEAVDEPSPEGFLRLFADLASVLSAESCVVLSSRVSFLADSPQIRRLLDCSSAISEQLVEQMYANGVDPQRVPRFSMLRLTDAPTDREPASDTGAAALSTPLARRLQNALDIAGAPTVAELIDTHIDHALADAGLAHLAPALVDTCGRAFLEDRTVFPLLELHNALGPQAFDGGRITPEDFRLIPLFRPAGPQALAFIHSAHQELLAARYLSTPDGREQAAELPGAPYLTEQVRAFLAAHPTANAHPAPAEDCVLHPGVYLVGPAERLLLRRVHHPIRFDRYPVTVARYRPFLQALRPDGTSPWDHPDQPPGTTHAPWTERLRAPDYYDDPRFDDHPAICVSWWAAYAFAAFEGKRLPTSLEWEAAARGTDGRLFPWGDTPDLDAVNCADTWAGRPLVTYQACKEEFDRGGLGHAWVTPVDARPANRSPYGIADMVGNVWEWTSTSVGDPDEAVICGGAFDNPLRAVQASAKGLFRRSRASNAVGFRCVTELSPTIGDDVKEDPQP
ncbi:SUMF1/EgtB/PvdO family nonheme iron enzyme [Streptomyces malaysiensis]|uniref:SUMF1/EgtB/PvdO family nonheme iron enzyme n=1 Tax=Streptomyces malaysiensis subsp. samsunensis TaxID=459658 RepID=A0A9X2LSA9_STRMQ|nr:SUMF1/EgtB/PvdO family nonheme iron enzyme [Streptomyces samsunensis]MCQ8829460.1 SUMF1/EgtB/PvdO family nonheme iron enzyme [Streptomyces samsunensis]